MKRIIIITQGLSRIVKPLYDSSVCDIVGIVECVSRGKLKSNNIIFSVLSKIYHISFSSVNITLEYFAKKHRIPYFYMTSSSCELESWVKSLSPDLIVVYSMSQLLKENIYSIPRFGTINLHPSYLPEYRGPNPIFWMYYNMEKQGGVTVHYIDQGEDTGNIILQKRYDIPLGMKSPDNFDIAIKKVGIELLLETIENIESVKSQEQPLCSPTKRARNLRIEEHKYIIDWQQWPIERVWHILRGTELWLNALPQPSGIYRGGRWIIGNYEKKRLNNRWKLGKIYHENGNSFIVCKDGVIYVKCKFSLKNIIKYLFNDV